MGWLSAAIGVIGGLFGRNDEKEAAADANRQSWDQMLWQNSYNSRQATKAFKRGKQNMRLADRMNDRNVRDAQKFQRRETRASWKQTDKSALRARRWGKQDYVQQKQDMLGQFENLRKAAKKGGFNPLSVLGASMVPNPAGGITSSGYAASPGVGPSQVQAPGVSAAMGGYGAPVAVPSLSSNDAILGGIQELGREFTGEAAQERAYAKMQMDLAKIEYEQAMGRASAPVVPSVGLGANSVTSYGARNIAPSLTASPEMGPLSVGPYLPGKAPTLHASDGLASPGADFGVESMPAPASTGRAIIKNRFTDFLGLEDGGSVMADSSGEWVGPVDAAWAAIQGVPQLGSAWANNGVRAAVRYRDEQRALANNPLVDSVNDYTNSRTFVPGLWEANPAVGEVPDYRNPLY